MKLSLMLDKMDKLEKIGIILFIIGALGFIYVWEYEIYLSFGWIGVVIFAATILMVLGACITLSD